MCSKILLFAYGYWGCILSFLQKCVECGSFMDREDIQNIDIKEGETLSLTCKAPSHLLRGYRWVYVREGKRKPRVLSSGRRLVVNEPRLSIEAKPEDKNVNLILNLHEIRPYEAGLFMCWRQGLKPDPKVLVRVLEVGAKEVEPLSIEISAPSHVTFGESLLITCIITPSWPGKIIWLKNDQEISDTDAVYTQSVQEKPDSGLHAILQIASARDSANYACKVPSRPPTKANVHLTVNVAKIESLTSVPKENAIEYGQHLEVTCLVSGTDHEVLWLKNGENLDFGVSEIGHSKVTLPSGKMVSKLDIQKFSKENNGQYSCYVPGDSKTILINIEGRPPIITEVKGWDFLVGDVLRLRCTTQYNKLGRAVTWLFNGEPLRQDWYPEQVVLISEYNITHYDLSLPIPTSHHVGTYTCTAPFGSASTQVREIVPPYPLAGLPGEVFVKEYDILNLPCSIMGYPAPVASWEKFIDGHWKFVEEAATEGYEELNNISIEVEPLTEETPESDDEKVGEKTTLIIENFKEINQGQFRCRGSNDHKEFIMETLIKLKEPTPEIVNISSDPVVEGNDLVIKCTIRHATEQVTFIKGFKILDQGIDSRFKIESLSTDTVMNEETVALVISGAKIEDGGTYECSSGKDVKAFVDAVVTLAPPTIVEIASSPAIENGEFFVSCTIENMFTEDEVEFYFDGQNLKSEEGSSKYSIHLAELKGETVVGERPRAKLATYVLKVRQVTVEDAGLYRCVLNSEEKDSVLVNVEELSNVEEVNLESSVAWLGGDLILTCTVTNWDGEVSFFHNTTMLLEEEDPRFYLTRKTENNFTIHELTIFEATAKDSGFYQCFTSPFVSAEVNVTMKSLDHIALTFTQIHSDNLVSVGSSMFLDCRVTGFGKYEHTIEISHDGRPYLYVDTSQTGAQVNARVTLVKDDEIGLDNSVLSYKVRLNNVEESDNGVWDCRATVPEAGLVLEDTTKVQVIVSPEFVDLPESEYAPYEGDDVLLNCSAKGLPIPDVMWYKSIDNVPIINATEFAQLPLYHVTDNDAGVYTCVAASLNYTISTQTTLKITKKDKIINQIELTIPKGKVTIIEMPRRELNLEEGSNVDLRCVANGTASPFVMWLKNEEVIASGHDYVIYSIESFESTDAGKYICKATFQGEETSDFTQLVLIESITNESSPGIRLASIGTTKSPQDFVTSSASTATFPSVIPTLKVGKLIDLSGPKILEEGSEFTILCLVSPLLAKYKFVISFNEMILTFDDELISADPRMSIVTGVGPFGDSMIALKVQEMKKEDAGQYKCTANTDPVAVDDHFIEIVPPGTLLHTATPELEVTTIPTSSETTYKSTVEKPSSSIYIPDLDLSTVGPVASTSNTAAYFDSSTTADFSEDYDFIEEIHIEDKVTVPTSFSNITEAYVGDEASLVCLTYILDGNLAPVYFWYKDTASRLLTAGPTIITSDRRISVTTDHIFDESTSTLVITDLTENDSGYYGCALNGKDEFSYEQLLIVLTHGEEQENFVKEEHINVQNEMVKTSTEHDLEETQQAYSAEENIQLNQHLTTSMYPDDEEGIHYTTISDVSTSTQEDFNSYMLENRKDNNFEIYSPDPEQETSDHESQEEHPEPFSTESTLVIAEKDGTRYGYSDHTEGTIGETRTTTKDDWNAPDVTSIHEEVTEDYVHAIEGQDETFFTKEEEIINEDKNGESEDNQVPEDDNEQLPTSENDASLSPDESQLNAVEQVDVVYGEGVEESDYDQQTGEDDQHRQSGEEDIDYETGEDNQDRQLKEDDKDHQIEEDNIDQHIKDKYHSKVEDGLREEDSELSLGAGNEERHSLEEEKTPVADTQEDPTPQNKDTFSSSDNEHTDDGYKSDELEDNEDSEEFEDEEPIIIVAIPGEDVKAPGNAEVILPCPTESVSEDITWKDVDNLLFLGSLDLAGVQGLTLTPDGELKLLPNVNEIKEEKTYTCFVFDYDTYEDVEVISYKVDLIEGDASHKPKVVPNDIRDRTESPPTSIYEFPGLEWQDVAVISNSQVAGESLVQVLRDGGIKAQLSSYVACSDSLSIDGWEEAQQSLKECESDSRASGLLRKHQSVFIILDFSVSLPSNQRYSSTLIYVHNKGRKIKSHVFGPLVPLEKETGEDIKIECGSQVGSSPDVGLDSSDICRSWIASTILNLQETYLSHSRQLPMVKK